jgi:hypothetical protein
VDLETAYRAQQADRDEIAQQLDALKHEKTALETQLEAIRAEYAHAGNASWIWRRASCAAGGSR